MGFFVEFRDEHIERVVNCSDPCVLGLFQSIFDLKSALAALRIRPDFSLWPVFRGRALYKIYLFIRHFEQVIACHLNQRLIIS